MTNESQALAGNLNYWNSVRNRANSGELHVDPGVARECDMVCADYLVALNRMQEMTKSLSKPEAFGDLPSAQQLGAKFHRLAVGDQGSARFAIAQQIDIIKTMREFFQHYFDAVEATDVQTSADISTSVSPR